MDPDPARRLLEEIGTVLNAPSFTDGRAGFENVVVRIAHDAVGLGGIAAMSRVRQRDVSDSVAAARTAVPVTFPGRRATYLRRLGRAV